MSRPICPPKQAAYDISSKKPRLSLRNIIDKIAEFLVANNIYWTGIELEPSGRSGTFSPETSAMAAGKSLRIYVNEEEPTVVSYLFQQSSFVVDQLPDGIEKVEFLKICPNDEVLASPRERNQRRDSEERWVGYGTTRKTEVITIESREQRY